MKYTDAERAGGKRVVSLVSFWMLRILETSTTSCGLRRYETVLVQHMLGLWCVARTASSTSLDRQG